MLFRVRRSLQKAQLFHFLAAAVNGLSCVLVRNKSCCRGGAISLLVLSRLCLARKRWLRVLALAWRVRLGVTFRVSCVSGSSVCPVPD